MASIEKRTTKKGISYTIIVSNGYDVTGKKIREKATYIPDVTMTPKQQETALKAFVFEFEQRVKQGKFLSGEKITFKEFGYKWLKEYAKNQLAVTTYDSYCSSLDKHIYPLLGHYRLAQIKPLHLQSIYNKWISEGLQPATVKRRHAIISVILKTAVQWQIIDTNPCEKVQLPKSNKDISDIKYFTPEQVNIFLQSLDESYPITYKSHTRIDDTGKQYSVKEYTEYRTLPKQLKLFYTLAIYTGMRRGELIALTWTDIDFNNNMINVNKSTTVGANGIVNKGTKNKTSIRNISIPLSIMNLLRDYKREQTALRLKLGNLWEGKNHIFIQWNGKQMYPDTATHTFRDLLIRHNSSDKVKNNPELRLPLIPLHGLRHTNATLLIASNKIDIKTIQKHLGHASTNTTLNIYAHPLEELEKGCSRAIEEVIKSS